jgi:hypothetical protein
MSVQSSDDVSVRNRSYSAHARNATATATSISTEVPRQRNHADRRARVPARIAEHSMEELTCAVDDRRLRNEARRAGDEAQHREHPLDPVEAAELGPQDRQCVARTPARGLRTLLDRDRRVEHARMHELAIEAARELSGRAREPAVDDDRVERLVWRIRARQLEAERAQTGSDGIGHGVARPFGVDSG